MTGGTATTMSKVARAERQKGNVASDKEALRNHQLASARPFCTQGRRLPTITPFVIGKHPHRAGRSPEEAVDSVAS